MINYHCNQLTKYVSKWKPQFSTRYFIFFLSFLFKRVFEAICHQEMPDLMKHLDELTCELSPVTFNWFMTIFVDSLPVEVSFSVK